MTEPITGAHQSPSKAWFVEHYDAAVAERDRLAERVQQLEKALRDSDGALLDCKIMAEAETIDARHGQLANEIALTVSGARFRIRSALDAEQGQP